MRAIDLYRSTRQPNNSNAAAEAMLLHDAPVHCPTATEIRKHIPVVESDDDDGGGGGGKVVVVGSCPPLCGGSIHPLNL